MNLRATNSQYMLPLESGRHLTKPAPLLEQSDTAAMALFEAHAAALRARRATRARDRAV